MPLRGRADRRDGAIGAPDRADPGDPRRSARTVTVIVLTLSREAARLDEMFDAGAERSGVQGDTPSRAAPRSSAKRSRVASLISTRRRVRRLARRARTPRYRIGPLCDVSSRCCRLVAAGSTDGEIAGKLWVTEQTVKFHLSNIYRKLEVGNRTEASRYAHVNGLCRRRVGSRSDRPAGGLASAGERRRHAVEAAGAGAEGAS